MGHGFGEQLWGGAALGSRSSLAEQLCAAASNRSFEKPQLWGAAYLLALERNFGVQLSAAILRSSFREQLWRIALRSSFARQLRTAALKNRSFGEQLWGLALGSSCGEPLWGATLGVVLASLRTILQNNCFEEQHFLGAAFGGSFTDNFGEQLSVATLWRSFLEPLCGIALGGAAPGHSFGEQPW